jgi:hypothetical protein
LVESLYMLCFLNYHFIIVKNLYMLYTQKSTSLIVKTLALYKCYEILLQRHNIYKDPTV